VNAAQFNQCSVLAIAGVLNSALSCIIRAGHLYMYILEPDGEVKKESRAESHRGVRLHRLAIVVPPPSSLLFLDYLTAAARGFLASNAGPAVPLAEAFTIPRT